MNSFKYFRLLTRLWLKKRGLMNLVWKRSRERKRNEKQRRKRELAMEWRDGLRDRRRQKGGIPPYLANNSWEQELNFKLWITKGARFHAARRCEEKSVSAAWATALLSVYLIVLGLLPLIPSIKDQLPDQEVLGVFTTAISIILLSYSLVISGRQYPLQAKAYHECSLKIGVLYDSLRQAKEIQDQKKKTAEIARITKQYEDLLPYYANHTPIDLHTFKGTSDYFKVGFFKYSWHKVNYYSQTKILFHLVVLFGVLACAYVVWLMASAPAP